MKRVLVLDDAFEWRERVEDALWDYEVILCGTLEEAKSCQLDFDFAVVDICLDGNGGMELSEEFVREVLLPSKIPFCRISSSNPMYLDQELIGLGHVSKTDRFFNTALHSLLRANL